MRKVPSGFCNNTATRGQSSSLDQASASSQGCFQPTGSVGVIVDQIGKSLRGHGVFALGETGAGDPKDVIGRQIAGQGHGASQRLNGSVVIGLFQAGPGQVKSGVGAMRGVGVRRARKLPKFVSARVVY